MRHNDLFDISGGSQPPKSKFIEREKEGYIRLFQIRDYGSNPQPIYIPLSTASKISQKGDILLARYGASLGKVFYAEYGAYNVALAKVIPLYESRLIFQKYIFCIIVVQYIKMKLSIGVVAPKRDSIKKISIHYYSPCLLCLNNIEL